MMDIDTALDRASKLTAEDFKRMSFNSYRAEKAAHGCEHGVSMAFVWSEFGGGQFWSEYHFDLVLHKVPPMAQQLTLHAMIKRYDEVMRDA